MKKIFWIGLLVLIVLIAGLYKAYDNMFPKAGPIRQIKVSETNRIYIYDNSENEIGMTIWSERKHKISLLPDGKEKYALHLGQPLLSPHQIESYCCPKCKKIIIDATEYENNLD